MTRCAVYHCVDSGGRVLYVGQSVQPKTRFSQHRATRWWASVDHIRVTWFDTRELALVAEQQGITKHLPPHNVQGLPDLEGPPCPFYLTREGRDWFGDRRPLHPNWHRELDASRYATVEELEHPERAA